MRGGKPIVLFISLALSLLPATGDTSPSRIKDIATISGLGSHKLIGYGIVAGLEGSGDSDNSALTSRSMANLLEKLGLTVTAADFKGKNLAAVLVTAELPAVARAGSTLDCTVSSLADARSLQGGTLLLTPLTAANGEVYALAQGALTVGGFVVSSRGGDSVQKNHVTVARLPGGASIVKELTVNPPATGHLCLSLRQPDYTTAMRLAQTINVALGATVATATDHATVGLALSQQTPEKLLEMIVTVENLPIEPDTVARVVINERTGTVVIGQQVRISPVAICHGGLTVEVQTRTEVSQPPAVIQGDLLTPPAALVMPAAAAPAAVPAVAGGREQTAGGLTAAEALAAAEASLLAAASQPDSKGAKPGHEAASVTDKGIAAPSPTLQSEALQGESLTGWPTYSDQRAGPGSPRPEYREAGLLQAGERPAKGSALTGGRTVVVKQDELQVSEGKGHLVAVPEQATLDDLVAALNTLGVRPRDLIAIIQALKEAGALQAELVLF